MATGEAPRFLVCVKRVPDIGGEIALDPPGTALDERGLGHTVSAHEECAVELAVRAAAAAGGSVTVLTVGAPVAVEQLRNALAVGCDAAVLVAADLAAYGPADVAAAVAEVVAAHAAAGTAYELVLLGNDAADTGDFQVGIRLAYLLDRPVVTGVKTFELAEGAVEVRSDAPDGGTETYRVPLPAVLTVSEGGVAPRYPSIPGRMKAKRVQVEERTPSGQPAGSGRLRLELPPARPSEVQVLGEGPEAAPAVVDLLEKLGVTR